VAADFDHRTASAHHFDLIAYTEGGTHGKYKSGSRVLDLGSYGERDHQENHNKDHGDPIATYSDQTERNGAR
jgi:hypothetical protein